jgi:hypothetical protein
VRVENILRDIQSKCRMRHLDCNAERIKMPSEPR